MRPMPSVAPEDGPPDGAPRVDGLLGQRRGGLEAAERQHGVDRAGDHPGDARVRGRGVAGAEHRQRVGRAGLADEQRGEHDEHDDLEQAEDGAQPRRGLDAVEAGQPDDHRPEHRPRPPEVRRDALPLAVQRARRREAELQEQQGRHERLDEDVTPGDQEADRRVQAAAGVRRDRPAAGRCRASSPIDDAANRQATIAMITDSGSAPPANAAPAGMDAAIAAPGAIAVMLWNSTSRRPTASRRSRASDGRLGHGGPPGAKWSADRPKKWLVGDHKQPGQGAQGDPDEMRRVARPPRAAASQVDPSRAPR